MNTVLRLIFKIEMGFSKHKKTDFMNILETSLYLYFFFIKMNYFGFKPSLPAIKMNFMIRLIF